MPAKRSIPVLALVCLLAVPSGCVNKSPRATNQPAEVIVPAGVAGTVGEYAVLVGGEPMMVRGWGVVVGLGENGSSEVPEGLRRLLIEQMSRYKMASSSGGRSGLTPQRMLEDKDTAVVTVTGQIPPLAPEGTRFDVFVSALPQSQTISLDGGHLLGTELRLSTVTGAAEFGQTRVWALGKGAVFVNPFTDRANQTDQARLRSGLIPGGGVVTAPRLVRLELRRPDYRLANQIISRVNERFGGAKVAIFRHPSLVDIQIPPAYRDDYVHFLQLLTHVHLSTGPGADEGQARQLTKAILLPTARSEDIALAWEAMGRQVLPIVRGLYACDNPAAAFYALRTGLRLRDGTALDPMMRVANQNGSPFQIAAIGELGRARAFLQSVPTLKALLSNANDLVRVAAYEALMAHGAAGVVQRTELAGQFILDVVDSPRDWSIYATRTGQPKLVLFGRNIPINRPLFYCPSDELVTLNAAADDPRIKVDRKVPLLTRRSETFEVAADVAELVRTLGSLPNTAADGSIEGLGLTYSQVVGVLYGLNKAGHIPAKFVLQQPPEMKRMYSASSAGRPDLPEEGR